MEKTFSFILSFGLAMLTLSGFTMQHKKRPKHLLGLMNVDRQHSVLRVPLTLSLLYAGSQRASLKDTRAILSFIGVFYLTMGVVGCFDRKVGGALPSKLTNFDLVYHFGTGALALWLGVRSGRMIKP
jgi:hypothetical protein